MGAIHMSSAPFFRFFVTFLVAPKIPNLLRTSLIFMTEYHY